ADAVIDAIGLAVDDADAAVIDAERFRRDLRHHRLEALAERGAAGHELDIALGIDAHARAVRGAAAAFLEKDGDAAADCLAGGPALGILGLHRIPAKGRERLVE